MGGQGQHHWLLQCSRLCRYSLRMAPKKKDCQIEITSDAQFREICRDKENFLLETYSEKWGTCKCYRASYEKVKLVAGEPYDTGIEPVYHMFEDGQKTKTMVGVDGPAIEATLQANNDRVKGE